MKKFGGANLKIGGAEQTQAPLPNCAYEYDELLSFK